MDKPNHWVTFLNSILTQTKTKYIFYMSALKAIHLCNLGQLFFIIINYTLLSYT